MPYIPQEERDSIGLATGPETPGQLNWYLTQAIQYYLVRREVGYADYNEVMGVLECMKMEIYRRMVAPYEDQAKERNGDVFY